MLTVTVSIAPICKQGPQAKPPRSSLIGKVRTELKATKTTEATKQYPKPVTMVLPAYVYKKPDSNVPTSLPPALHSSQMSCATLVKENGKKTYFLVRWPMPLASSVYVFRALIYFIYAIQHNAIIIVQTLPALAE